MTSTSAEFEKATDFQFRDEDIARAKALVGRWSPSSHREHLTAVTHDAMRNFARGYGDDNPLFTSEDYGKSTRWAAQVAPPMIGIALNKPLLGDPPDKSFKRPSFRGIHVFVSGSTWTWYRPLEEGDQLYSFGGIESVEEKKSEFAGRSILITNAAVKMNQRAEIVAISRTLAIYTERKTARKKGKYAEITPATYTDEDIARLDEIYAAEQARGAETRWWEDVAVGDVPRPMAKGPLTETDMIVFHAGGYGFVPYAPSSNRIAYKNRMRIAPFYVKNAYGVPDVAQRVHWDSDWAQAIGNPMAYDYGVMRDCWLSHFLTDWMGDEGWLVSQSSQMRNFNYIGDSHVITGEVTGKRIEDGRCLVDIEMRGTNQRETVTCPGRATVALPSREHGPVRLPGPPADLQDQARALMARHGELSAERALYSERPVAPAIPTACSGPGAGVRRRPGSPPRGRTASAAAPPRPRPRSGCP
jgi:acyl dehydratase